MGKDEEKGELLECDSCHQMKSDVKLRRDPFLWEVHDEEKFRYLCDDCYETRREDV